MATPTSPVEHGTLIYYGAEGYEGLYIQSATFASKHKNQDMAEDEDGITRTVRLSNGSVDVSFEGFLLDGSTAPVVGVMATYSSHTTGSLTNIIVLDVTERTSNKGFVTISVSGVALEGIPAA